MSYLNAVAPATQFAMTAACDSALKKANVEKGPLLCSALSPAVQTAGSHVYRNALQKTAEGGASFNHSSTLSPLEEAGAGALGAYAGYKVLNKVGDALFDFLIVGKGDKYYSMVMRVNDAQSSSFVRAGMAVLGTNAATYLAGLVKQTYSSQASSSTAERAPIVRTEA